MNDSAADLVRLALAIHLDIGAGSIEDDARLKEDLALDPLDLVLIALRFEELAKLEFPVGELEHATTVAAVICIVRAWWPDLAAPSPRLLRTA